MKIIQFTDSFLPVTDGVGNVVYHYVCSMAEKGHEVYVVAPQKDYGFRGDLPFEIIDYIGFNLYKLKNYRVGFPALDSNCHSRLNMVNADIVHVHTPFTAGQAGLAYAKERKRPVIGTFHSNYYDDILQLTGIDILATVGSKYVANFYNKCDEVWAVSRKSASILNQYGCNKKIMIMENGADGVILDVELKEKLRNKYALGNYPVLLYMGQMDWKKNIRCILYAASKLKCEYRLILAGAGPHEKEILSLTKVLGISDKIRIIGFISDNNQKNALFSLADLFVFPSVYDTSGLVVKEAAAAGTPSVTVKGSGASEGIIHGVNGFLCENSSEDLARVIYEALTNPDRLRKTGDSAKRSIPVSWKRITDQVIDNYEDILKKYSSYK